MPNDVGTGFLSAGGDLGALMRRYDWSSTPLGPAERWPQALKTAVRIMLTSRQPMFVWWGDELINLYNDAYRSILGGKHPKALGEPASDVWREIWDQVAPRVQTAMSSNEGTYDEALLLIMERYGYPEETYYTFSYSPVPNDEGGPGGILCANTDDTERIISERQLALLLELAARPAEARTVGDACARAARSLETNGRDLPFALLYLFDAEHRRMHLAGLAGIESGHRAAPPIVPLDGDSIWPFDEILSSNAPCLVTDLRSAGELPSGAWRQPPRMAAVVPVNVSGQAGNSAVLVAALNPFRKYDESYQGFLKLVSSQIAAAIVNAQAYEEERKRAESLAELDRAKTAFFSNVSHEFRTPLTLLLGPLEELLAKPASIPDHDAFSLVEVAHRNALRLMRLVNALLDFSRIEAGRVNGVYQATDLAQLTADLASTFRSVIEKAALRLIVDCPPLPQPAFVDRDMWEKVVLNLLSNAFKYTFTGEIAVGLHPSPDGSEAVLTVRDTGTGIPASELPHLFERFRRVEGARGRTHEGTGIGLALVQELIRLHDGSVDVESEAGKGSTFTIRIPFRSSHLRVEVVDDTPAPISTPARAAMYVEEAGHWLPAGPSAHPAETARPHVLLADDNADMRDYVRRLLETQYEVTAVANGQDAVAAALERPPDLVLSDVMMPVLDGFGLVSALRDDPRTRSIPLILLSARAGEDSRIEGLRSGADDYLVKPFTARELLTRVETHLRLALMRRESGQALRAAAERLSLALESTDLGTWDHDLLTGELTCSERFKTICGLAPDAPLSFATVNDIAHPEDRERTRQDYENTLASDDEASFQSEFRLLLPDGSVRWVLSKGKVLREQTNEGFRPVRVVGTLMDITDRKRSEESLREMQKLESLGLLAGGIAHDFNNLLTGVIGNASLLETEFSPSSRQAEIVHYLMESADRMARLTSQMLAYSGRGRFVIERISLSRHVSQIVSLIQASIPKTVELRLMLDNNLPEIEADSSQLQQVIMNLVINGAEAIDAGPGMVAVSTSVQDVGDAELSANVTRQNPPAGQYVVLTVQDTGQGMDAKTQERIFDPFFTTKFTGRGLGLAAVLGIVRGHQGLLTVDSHPGAGTTFRVFFPVHPDAVRKPNPPTAAEHRSRGTVLFVDDEDVVRSTAAIALTQAGYEVLLARNGQDAIELFAADPNRIDLVILDMTMPVMGGAEALRQIVDIRPDVVVLGSSGFDEREAHQRFGNRIAGFLQKPYTASQLTAMVANVLPRN